jgi:putative ABC transport system permease protein
LHSNLRGEIEPNTDISTIYIFSAIAFFILMIACLNYINLSTAGYTIRAKEVGLRKVLGASRPQLIRQFLGESFLIILITLPLAVLLAELFLPLFNSLAFKELEISYLHNVILLLGLAGIIICVGFISGLFPAFYVSALKPVQSLKGMFQAGTKASLLRKFLVIFQFAISIIFIISTVIMYNQLDFMRNKKLGFNKEHIVNMPIYSTESMEKREIVKSEFLRNPDVLAVSASSFFPGKNNTNINYWHEGLNRHAAPVISCLPVDSDFL